MAIENQLFKTVPSLQSKLHPVSLIAEPTPIHDLPKFAAEFGVPSLLIKREDQTDTSLYGGNKVRNLEYVLGEAMHLGCDEVATLIAYGSNFTAALAAQSKRVGLKANLAQFVLQRNPQIEAHVAFGKRQGAHMTTFETMPLAFGLASLAAGRMALRRKTFFIVPGASSVLGALGHTNALLESVDQIRHQKLQMPDRIVVGAGTCGTIAGLMAGVVLSGEKIKITGVRCADKIVCNPKRVARLANEVLAFAGASKRISVGDVHLIEALDRCEYAQTAPELFEAQAQFYSLEQIHLDTTYTAKVVFALMRALREKQFGNEKLLYWHTYSPKAMEPIQ